MKGGLREEGRSGGTEGRRGGGAEGRRVRGVEEGRKEGRKEPSRRFLQKKKNPQINYLNLPNYSRK
jgi:hypothetical protein